MTDHDDLDTDFDTDRLRTALQSHMQAMDVGPGDPDVVAATGRRKRAVMRIASATAALAVVGGGVAALAQITDGRGAPEVVDTVPAPTASPEPSTPDVAPTPEPSASDTTEPTEAPSTTPESTPTPTPAEPTETPEPDDGDQGGTAESVHSPVETVYGELGPELAVEPNDGTDGTAGSGCRPGTDSTLPDGIWMVDVVGFGPDQLEVDLLCFSTVESLDAAGMDSLIKDWTFSNDSDLLRTLPLGDGASMTIREPQTSVTAPRETQQFDDPEEAARFAAEVGIDTPTGWLVVVDGEVLEFYAPDLRTA